MDAPGVKHRVKIRLSPEDLLKALGAPASVHLHKVIVSDDPEIVWVVVEHSDLPTVAPFCETQAMDLAEAEQMFDDISTADAYR